MPNLFLTEPSVIDYDIQLKERDNSAVRDGVIFEFIMNRIIEITILPYVPLLGVHE